MVHIYRRPVKDNAPATTRGRAAASSRAVGKALSKAARRKQRELREQAARECRVCLGATNAGAKGHVTLAKREDGSAIGSKLMCRHTFCHECLREYIESQLKRVEGDPHSSCFPLCCPECDTDAMHRELPEELINVVLGQASRVRLKAMRTLEQRVRFWCPAPRCSTLVVVHKAEDGQHRCPNASCHAQLCVLCKELAHPDVKCQAKTCVECLDAAHDGLTCEEFRAVPHSERTEKDLTLWRLIKAHRWARCPECRAVVERVSGCDTMACICGKSFCYSCGGDGKTPCTDPCVHAERAPSPDDT